MNCFKKHFGFIDFLHVRENYPLIKTTTQSSLGIILSILMILSLLGFLIYEIENYDNNYTLSFSQEFVENITNKIQITFGFQIANESSPYEIDYRVYDSLNRTINYTYCNEKFEEISYDDYVENNYNDIYRCFINYPIIITDQFNHFMKIHLINERFSEKGRVPFKLKFKEPIIDHDSKDPFVENEKQPLDLLFFYDTELQSYYRKYLKIVDYNTQTFWSKSNKKNKYYLEDFEDSSRINAYNNSIYDGKFLGTFRLVLAKKKEVYTRKYLYFTDFISKMGGYLSILKPFFSALSFIFVNPIDNLRIFTFLKNKKPSIYNRSKLLLSEFYKNKNRKIKYIYDDKELNDIKTKDKFFYLCYKYGFCCKNKCCKIKKSKHLEAIDNFFNKNLTIDKYLEESFRNKNIDKSIQKYINKNKDKIQKEKNIEKNNDKPTDIDIEYDNITKEFIKNEILFRADSLKDEDKNICEKELSNIEKEIQNMNDGKDSPLINDNENS